MRKRSGRPRGVSILDNEVLEVGHFNQEGGQHGS